MTQPRLWLKGIGCAALLLLACSCNARKKYPSAAIGWHTADYSVIFGRLQRLPAATPEDPPAWIIRFGEPRDAYTGEFALTPVDRLIGYRGGERVELRGHLLDQTTTDAFNGRWYVVDAIRLWEGHR